MKLFNNTLYIVSTPIGNLGDITLRALEVIKKSDIILCEDTRRTLKLLNHFKVKKKVVSLHKFNERKQLNNIIEYFNQGKILSLVSDAGTPLLSDPGIILLNECIKKNIKSVPIPGASSITAAMSVSGFDDKFLFYGFLPKTENELNKVLSSLSGIQFCLVFFVPSLKIIFYLKQFKKYFLGRKILIAKEISKLHEFFYRGNIEDIELPKIPLKGEITLVISQKKLKVNSFDEEKIINKAKKLLKKYSLKDTVNLIMEIEKKNKKKIYDICLKLKNEKNS
tara:strand:+ start:13586 stop:14425 length:840 start_codon:yes stop_codon:yes gene_type:complete